MLVISKITTRSILLLTFCFSIYSCNNKIISYPVIAHSHNDYEQDVPIKTALDLGFTSLEVDIVYHEGRIVVSHDLEDLASKPDFESGYLIPFLENISPSGKYFLLVDLKNYSPELIASLNSIFLRHKKELVSRINNKGERSLVQILLSGDFPRDQIIDDKRNTHLFIDGRLQHLLESGFDSYTPLISMNLRHVTQWRGNSEPSEKVLMDISNVVKKVHESGKMIRFWNTPDTEIMWRTLKNLKVDIIGVDDLAYFYNVNFSRRNN